MKYSFATLLVLVFACAVPLYQEQARAEPVPGEWSAYGGDAGGMSHASLDQIDRDNVTSLEVAWTFRTGELETYEGTKASEKAAFEATPIVIGDTLYFSTPTTRVFALDATTGKQRWTFDPQIDLTERYSEITSRGVSYWKHPESDDRSLDRVFVPTLDARLIALNARTGKPVLGFGTEGVVDMKEGVGDVSVTSPPAIIGDLLVIGSSMGDNWTFDYPAGVVRAYDVHTGKLRWSWDPIPRKRGNPGWETWRGKKAFKTGAANAWAPISADEDRDLVFIPTSCPSPDYYGGERLGDNLYANSIVALKASTGKVVWSFQVVHHDLWDYDIAAQPSLIEVDRDGQAVPAVAIGTKMGHLFLFHRETGKPLFPIEERPVPQTDVLGEETSPTQPFPVLPEPLGLRNVAPEDAFGLDDEGREAARKRIASLRFQGVFTPPSVEGTIVSPSNVGGINWGGLAYDPDRRILVTAVNRIAAVITLIPRDEYGRRSSGERLGRLGAEFAPQRGTAFGLKRENLMHFKDGAPIPSTPPPWSTLVGVDMNSGKRLWEVPLGTPGNPDEYPGSSDWGSVSLGGAITTTSGLVFIASTLDSHLRAFDIESGNRLWVSKLPAGGQATPMSYRVGATPESKQFVVIAAGGHGKMGTPLGDYVIAYALP